MKIVIVFLSVFFYLCSYSQTIGLTPFATGFTNPIEISHPDNDIRLFIVEQGGKIKIVNPDGTTNTSPFLTLTTATISTGGERGLLGLAFHPNYASNGYFYINYTNTAGNTVIARYSVSADPNIADSASSAILLTINQPFSNHNGGCLKFGSDGYLYIGMGDGGSAGDPGKRAQNPNELLGKMLRIDVDASFPYGIPPTNPYAGSLSAQNEIWAIGLRNPWKFSFDTIHNNLWIADVGQNQNEEINKVSITASGINYGWNCYEGNSIYSSCTTPSITYTFPVAEYSHTLGCSITGGYVYNGTVYPNFQGNYFFADYCSNKIGVLNSSETISWSAAFSGSRFTSFGEDSNGELYIAASGNGTIYKIIDTSLSVDGFNKSNVIVYPNPATNEFFIKANNLHFPALITISDSTGKILLKTSLESVTQPILTTSLLSGIYFIAFKDKRGNHSNSKLILK